MADLVSTLPQRSVCFATTARLPREGAARKQTLKLYLFTFNDFLSFVYRALSFFSDETERPLCWLTCLDVSFGVAVEEEGEG